MKQQNPKKVAKIVKIREHRERIARVQLQREMDKVRSINKQLRAKRNETRKKSDNFYAGLEERFVKTAEDYGTAAAFSTFAATVNAARQDLVLSEQAVRELQGELDKMRERIITLKQDARTALIELKKVEQILSEATKQKNSAGERKAASEMEEIATSSYLRTVDGSEINFGH